MEILRWRHELGSAPVVRLKIAGPGIGKPEYNSLFESLGAIVEQPKPVVLIWDMARSHRDATRRMALVEWLKEHIGCFGTKVLAVALVAPTPVQRHSIATVLWFFDKPCPVQVFHQYPESEAWALQQAPGTPAAEANYTVSDSPN